MARGMGFRFAPAPSGHDIVALTLVPRMIRPSSSRLLVLRLLFALVGIALAASTASRAEESESMAVRSLRKIVERQKQLLADAEKQGDKLDQSSFQEQAQSIVHEYDLLLAQSPSFAAGYASYGYFLGKVGMRKESLGMLLKANQLDPNIPLVKNQIGNFLAEDGKPIEALPYFLAAVKLAPNEPLYHYQLGTLLAEARDTFLKSGEWTRAALDHAMQGAFKRATELAPDDFAFAYRYAESFYDLGTPDWDAALKQWSTLEEKAQTPIERQTMRLHAANVLIKMGKLDHAKALIDTVDVPELQVQKQRLVVQLQPPAKK